VSCGWCVPGPFGHRLAHEDRNVDHRDPAGFDASPGHAQVELLDRGLLSGEQVEEQRLQRRLVERALQLFGDRPVLAEDRREMLVAPDLQSRHRRTHDFSTRVPGRFGCGRDRQSADAALGAREVRTCAYEELTATN
jgi:hypothetical protein